MPPPAADIHRFFRRLIAAYCAFAVVAVAALMRAFALPWPFVGLGVAAFAVVMAALLGVLASRLELPLIPGREDAR